MAAERLLCITSKQCEHRNLQTQQWLALRLLQGVAFYQQHVKGDSETALYLYGCVEVMCEELSEKPVAPSLH